MATAQTTPQKRKASGAHRHRSLKGVMITLSVFVCLFFSALALYPPARDYYLALREVNQLNGELAAVRARNEQIAIQIAVLQTPEGIQDRAREQLGMVMNGESAVNITGLNLTTSSTALPAEIARGLLVKEESWWADFLDTFFAVPEPAEPVRLDDPFQSDNR